MIQYCNHCGAGVTFSVPPGDSLPRHICDACGHIHYENPRLVVGCVVEWEDRILLCRRAIEPRLGFWTLPAGFMENGETTASPHFAAGVESLEVDLYHPDQIPWRELAFRSVTLCLERYFADRAKGVFGFHETDIPAG